MTRPGVPRRRSFLRFVLWTLTVLVALFLLIQFVPYGRDHSNPPVTDPFAWASPQAEAIARTSCYDCHSNETRWWWAVKLAPLSWLAQRDMEGARSQFNFSAWDGEVTGQEIQEAVDGKMPPWQYTVLHPGAKLTEQEKKTLVDGFLASLSAGSTSSPSPTPTPTSTSEGSATPSSSDPTAIIAARCSVCHSAKRALKFRAADAAEAEGLIAYMVQQGATITSAEKKTLVDYFTR